MIRALKEAAGEEARIIIPCVRLALPSISRVKVRTRSGN